MEWLIALFCIFLFIGCRIIIGKKIRSFYIFISLIILLISGFFIEIPAERNKLISLDSDKVVNGENNILVGWKIASAQYPSETRNIYSNRFLRKGPVSEQIGYSICYGNKIDAPSLQKFYDNVILKKKNERLFLTSELSDASVKKFYDYRINPTDENATKLKDSLSSDFIESFENLGLYIDYIVLGGTGNEIFVHFK